ncbi:MAG: helix-turn-helix domain-containing protein [Thermoplasmatota archaeon]|nr:winged helix-turn-helix transcriptional regulator [Candidatus Thermoplasmatota archaeon]MBU1915201.1 winged helix-turn-helix transcriptional regulator [Candidatus Thermoplasmatota archaeon]
MKDPLELGNRKRIFEAIRQNPGVHFRELQRLTSMPIGVLSYHLNYLVDRGLLTVDKQESFTRYFPGGQLGRDKQQMLAALRQEIPRGIILFLLMNPGATHGEVLRSFTISGGTLSYHIKKLVSRGLIRMDKAGRESRMTVIDPDKVSDLLIVYRRSFLDKLVDEFVASYIGAGGLPAQEAGARTDSESTGAPDSTGSSEDPPDQRGPDSRS